MTRAAFAMILCAALTTAPLTLHADDTKPTAPAEHVEKSELHHQMEQMDKAMKLLRRSLRKPDGRAESLDLIAQMETCALAAKAMTPSKAQTLPAGDRDKFTLDYRKQMSQLLEQFCALEEAVCDNDMTKAQDLFKNLKVSEDKGHDQFMEDEDKK